MARASTMRPRPLRARTLVIVALCVLVLAVGTPCTLGAFHEDPHKVLGVARGATESEIKRAYRSLALKWHPDKNPGNPDAEQQFMRIGAAYDQLTSGNYDTAQPRYGYGNRYNQQQQQWRYQQQQHQQRQHQYYNQQQHGVPPFPFSFSFSTLALLAVVVWVMVVLPTYMQPDAPASSNQSTNSNTSQQQQKKAETDDEPRPSPHEQLARVFAPSLFAFKPLYLTARGRRLLLFFPNPNAFGSNVRDQFSAMEKLASEFARDPVTFCWLDLACLPAAQRVKWEAQFNQSQGKSTSPFFAAFSSKGKKVSLFSPARSEKVDIDDARKWISRLLGGEISQEEALPTLFTN